MYDIFPEKHKNILSENGFDVMSFICVEGIWYIFNGICNENSFKYYPIFDGQTIPPESECLSIGGILHRKKELNGKTIAIKIMDPRNLIPDTEEDIVMRRLYHRNVIETYRTFAFRSSDPKIPKRTYIVMEYLNSGTLEQMILNIIYFPQINKRLEQNEVKCLLRQLSNGLRYIHNRGVVHNDIQMGNIMFTKIKDEELIPKYIDFGLARICDESQRQKNDIISLGLIFMALIDEQIAKLFLNIKDQFENITNQMIEGIYTDINVLDQHLNDILNFF